MNFNIFSYFSKKSLYRLSLKKLDYQSAIIFDKKLSSLKASKCEAILIDISASNGRITQCEDFVTQIKHFKNKNKQIPIYTFANEAITGASLLVLMAGDYSYIDKNTMMGLFDFSIKRNVYNKYLDDNNYSVKLITSGEHKIRLNPFKDIKEEDIQWMKNLLTKEKEIFMERVLELRGNRLKLNKGDLENYLNSTFINSELALKIGLVDGFHSVDSLRFEKFSKNLIKDLNISNLQLLKQMGKVNLQDLNLIKNEEFELNEIMSKIEIDYINYILNSNLKVNYI